MSGISAVILAFTALSTASAFSVVGPTLVLRSPTDVSAMSRSCKALGRVQMCTPQETTERRSVDLPGGNSPSPPLNELNPLTRTDKSWSERTTILDREQRINNDPLAPRKPRTFVPYEGQTMGGQKRADVEREGYEWYKSMEDQRSMFGRTLNPMTGSFEKKGKDVPVMNPFVDPIFYVILSIGSPFIIMFWGAYSCVVPALSLALGAECGF